MAILGQPSRSTSFAIRPLVCLVAALPLGSWHAVSFFSSDTNIALHLAGGSVRLVSSQRANGDLLQDLTTVKYTRKSIGIKDLRARVASQLTARSEGRMKLLDIVNDQIEIARDFEIRYDEVVDAVYDPLIAGVYSRLANVNNAANAVIDAASSVAAEASSSQADLSTQIAAEAAFRASLSTSIAASVTAARSTLTTARNAGAADLSTMRANKAVNSPLTTMNAAISSATSAEVSSAAAKLANQTAVMSSSIPAAASSLIAPLLASEKTRAEAKCATSVTSGAILFTNAASQPAANEYSSWFVDVTLPL